MSECLSISEIKQMELEELLSSKDKLPDYIDVSNLDESNIDMFRYWLDFIEEEQNKDSLNIEVNNGAKQYFAAAYLSILPLTVLHETLHAIGAKLCGGDVLGFGVNSKGAYTLLTAPNLLAVSISALLPNFVIPTFGFYMAAEGIENKDMKSFGVGVSAIMLNAGSFFLDYGDMSLIASQIAPTNTMLVGAMLSGANYLFAYKLAQKIRSIRD